MSISKVRLPNNTEEDIKAKYLIQSSSSDAVSEEFVTKTTTEDAIANIQKIYGNTIKFNQLVQNGNFANGIDGWTIGGGITTTISNGVLTASSLSNSGNRCISQSVSVVSGHKYYVAFTINSPVSGYQGYFATPTQWFPSLYNHTNEDYRYEQIVTAATDKATVFFGSYDLSTGQSYTISNIQLIDLTQIYGAGSEPSTVAAFDVDFPLDFYDYNPSGLLPVKATALQSKDSNNNVIGNCDLNIPTLTGKLNGAGSSVVIFPEGMKKINTRTDELYVDRARKVFGAVDLGTLGWTKGYGGFYSTGISSVANFSSAANTQRVLTAKYPWMTYSAGYNGSADCIFCDSSSIVVIKDAAYESSTAAQFKSAISGTELYYELKTPEEYILDNALQLQYPVVAGGTEMVLPTTGTAPMKMDVIYGNAADATSNLSSNFISVDSMKAFLNNLGTQMGGTWNMQYNNGKFEFTFSSS